MINKYKKILIFIKLLLYTNASIVFFSILATQNVQAQPLEDSALESPESPMSPAPNYNFSPNVNQQNKYPALERPESLMLPAPNYNLFTNVDQQNAQGDINNRDTFITQTGNDINQQNKHPALKRSKSLPTLNSSNVDQQNKHPALKRSKSVPAFNYIDQLIRNTQDAIKKLDIFITQAKSDINQQNKHPKLSKHSNSPNVDQLIKNAQDAINKLNTFIIQTGNNINQQNITDLFLINDNSYQLFNNLNQFSDELNNYTLSNIVVPPFKYASITQLDSPVEILPVHEIYSPESDDPDSPNSQLENLTKNVPPICEKSCEILSNIITTKLWTSDQQYELDSDILASSIENMREILGTEKTNNFEELVRELDKQKNNKIIAEFNDESPMIPSQWSDNQSNDFWDVFDDESFSPEDESHEYDTIRSNRVKRSTDIDPDINPSDSRDFGKEDKKNNSIVQRDLVSNIVDFNGNNLLPTPSEPEGSDHKKNDLNSPEEKSDDWSEPYDNNDNSNNNPEELSSTKTISSDVTSALQPLSFKANYQRSESIDSGLDEERNDSKEEDSSQLVDAARDPVSNNFNNNKQSMSDSGFLGEGLEDNNLQFVDDDQPSDVSFTNHHDPTSDYTAVPDPIESKSSGESEENDVVFGSTPTPSDSTKIEEDINQTDHVASNNIVAKKSEEDYAQEMIDSLDQSAKIIGSINSAILSLENNQTSLINSRLTTSIVAAGDEDTSIPKGLWISGLYGTSTQGTLQNIAGYRGNSLNVTIGFDVELNDDLLGIAYSNVRSNFKFRNIAHADKISVISHTIALYGQKELGKGFSLQGIVSVSRNYITNKVNRSFATINDGATGKYKNNSYSLDTKLNYKFITNSGLMIIPNIGIKYGHYRNNSYGENGNIGMQNLSVIGKSQNLLTGSIGTRLVLPPKQISELIVVTPTLHGSVEKYFNNKSQTIYSKISYAQKTITKEIVLPKQPKIGYNIGANLVAERKNVKLLLEYNYHSRGKKYHSHQGVVSIKCTF